MGSILKKVEQCCEMNRTSVVRTYDSSVILKMLFIFGRNAAEFA